MMSCRALGEIRKHNDSLVEAEKSKIVMMFYENDSSSIVATAPARGRRQCSFCGSHQARCILKQPLNWRLCPAMHVSKVL
jgi:hypothetical protein